MTDEEGLGGRAGDGGSSVSGGGGLGGGGGSSPDAWAPINVSCISWLAVALRATADT